MAAAEQKRRTRQEAPRLKFQKLLGHPWRVRILEALLQRDMSCSQMVDEELIPDLATKHRGDAISSLAYHFRLLREAGLIEVVDSIPNRGSHEHICRARSAPHHTTEEWSKLSADERRAITPMTLSSLTGLAEAAVIYGSFDNRVDRHLAYVPLELDEQAWADLGPVLDGVLDIIMRVHAEAKVRMARSGETPIRATWGQMFFESPPLLPRS